MNKRFFHLTSVLFMGALISFAPGCSQNNSDADVPNVSSSEESVVEPKEDTKHDVDESKVEKEVTQEKIKSDRNDAIWKSEEHDAAEKAANEFVSLVKNKDMAGISKKISYPIDINIDGKNVKIYNEKEFSSIDFNKIFDEKFINEINNTKELFSNWRGFMLGSGPNVWFSPNEKGEMLISVITTSSVS